MPEVRLSAAIAPPAAAPPTTTGTQAVICEIRAADKMILVRFVCCLNSLIAP